MVSLSTVYGVSIVLGSLAAIGSAFVGTKVYPIQTGGDPLAGPTALAATITGAFAAAKKAIEPAPEPLATETVKEEAEPVLNQTTEPTESSVLNQTTEPVNSSVLNETVPTTEPADSSGLDETIQSVPEDVGGRRLPPWFKRSGRKH